MSDNQIITNCLIRALSSGVRLSTEQEIEEYLKSQGLSRPILVESPPPCPYLKKDESDCQGGYHYTKHPEHYWRYNKQGEIEGYIGHRMISESICPVEKMNLVRARIEPEKERLKPLLKKYGYDPQSKPEQRGKEISECLYNMLDPERPVQNLGRLLTITHEICENPPPPCNVAFLGPQGVAKTTAQLAIHFAQLEAGVKSYFVDSIDLRLLFKNLSFLKDELVLKQFRNEFNALVQAEVIIWSDAGDTQSAYPTEFAENLKNLVERSSAVWIISSNLSREGLGNHVNFGRSTVSRLFADRNGIPAEVLDLVGPDQRSYHSRIEEKWGELIEFRKSEEDEK